MDLDLNFSIPEAGPSNPKKQVGNAKKGGKWTQRSNTKQKERRLSTKQNVPQPVQVAVTRAAAPQETVTIEPATQAKTSPSKASRPQIPVKQKKSENEQHGAPAQDAGSSQPKKSFISSLFTSMPEMPAPTHSAPVEKGLPSNAPTQGSFASLALYPELVSCLRSQKFELERPTPIQASAVPALHQANPGCDFILQAQTGSGKTLAYLLPIVQDLLKLGEQLSAEGNPPDRQLGTLAIVLVPTRELANQVYQVALNLLSMASNKEKENQEEVNDKSKRPHTWITPGLLSGGMSRQHEKARLRKGVPLLIATVSLIQWICLECKVTDSCFPSLDV